MILYGRLRYANGMLCNGMLCYAVCAHVLAGEPRGDSRGAPGAGADMGTILNVP